MITPKTPAEKAEMVKSLVAGKRWVTGYNQDSYEHAFQALQAPLSHTREERFKQVAEFYKQAAVRGFGQVPDLAPVPSQIRQAVVNRIQNRLLAQMWALEFAAVNPSDWGVTLSYRVRSEQLPRVYKIGSGGGNWAEIHANRDSVFTLGDPEFLTTPEILIPRFDPSFPGRFLEDIEQEADAAAIAIAEQIDTYALAAIAAQLDASTLATTGFNWISDKVVGVPTTNDLDLHAQAGITRVVYKEMALHAMKLGRRIQGIYMAPDTIGSMWDQTDAVGASSTYFPAFPETYRERIMAQGERAFMNFWGTEFPTPTPTNTIDVSGADKYFWGLLEPIADPTAPRGGFWLFTYPAAPSFGAGGAAYTGDFLQYMPPARIINGRVYDCFVMQKAYQVAYIDLQKPNVMRVQYAGS